MYLKSVNYIYNHGAYPGRLRLNGVSTLQIYFLVSKGSYTGTVKSPAQLG